jgi:allantoate deiminase
MTQTMTQSITQSRQSRAADAIAECLLLGSMTEEPGRTTRRFLTPPVAAVHAHLRARMAALGMSVWLDAAGNLRGLWQPEEPHTRRLIIGSHIDTVPDAGAYDGVLGVVLALALVAEAQSQRLPYALEVVAFSEEEGVRFGVPFLGSRAMAGRFDPALLDLTDEEGVTLAGAIHAFGLDPADLDAALVSQEAMGFLEIHIEQGPVLEAENLQLAVVTGIVGQTRCDLEFSGQANHAGTTPMDMRQDALAAAAEWISAVESLALDASVLGASGAEPAGLVASTGKLEVEPNAANVIAGCVRVSLDVRHMRDQVRHAAVEQMLARAEAIATRRGLACQSWRVMDQPAVPMDEELTALLADSLEAAGYPPRRMPSGAGHDAMVMATRLPTAMLFLRSPGGISHHPAEAVLEEDVAAALQVGGLFLRRLGARA